MRTVKWLVMLGAIGLLCCSAVQAQTVDANHLCIHSGAQYYVNGPYYGYPNHGSMKYYPSFTHWVSTPWPVWPVYPWKLAGWEWTGVQGYNSGSTWYWATCLQYSGDNPYSAAMSFDYPLLFCQGTVPHSGFPQPIYSDVVPSMIPMVGDYGFIFPSSSGGFDAYLNLFAVYGGSWALPSTIPFYQWNFGLFWNCASAVTIPSNNSIMEFVWMNKGPYNQYTLLGGPSPDCFGGGGNKGRNYSLICDTDNGYFWAWTNNCTGVQEEWAQCLYVCDAVTIPVNAPSNTGPFAAYGFDVGSATITPYLSSGCELLGFMVESGPPGQGYIILASFAYWPCIGPYGSNNYRVPHGWDVITNLFMGISGVFFLTTTTPYPSCMDGTTTGNHTLFLPFPPSPGIVGAEIRWSAFATGKNAPMTASYMATYF